MCRYAIKELHAIRSASGASKIMMFVICSVVHMMAGLLKRANWTLMGTFYSKNKEKGSKYMMLVLRLKLHESKHIWEGDATCKHLQYI